MQRQTKACSVQELRQELRVAVRQYMSADDKLLLCWETKTEGDVLEALMSLELPRPTYEAQVVTQHRIITAHSGKYGFSTSSMRLLDIVNVEESSFNDKHSVFARGHGDAVIGCSFGSQLAARKFAGVLREAIEEAKAIPTAVSVQTPKSAEDRLRALTQLHKDGLISDAEFQQIREEILGQL